MFQRNSGSSWLKSAKGAYLAWCLWNDLEEWRRFLHPSNLSSVYDPRPAREHMKKYGEVLKLLGPLVDEFETLTDAEAEQERRNAEDVAKERIALLERWLSDSRINGRAEELEKRRPKSFFELLNEDEHSVLQVLKHHGMRPGYAVYTQGSGVIHGSSVEAILFNRMPVIGPQIWAGDDEVLDRVAAVLMWARSCALALWLIRPGGAQD